MDKIEKILGLVTQGALAFAAVFLCVKLCTGCTLLRRTHANETLAHALREAYANGGAASVSNRIEKLVVSGDLSRRQADRIHDLAQKVDDGVVERLESEVASADLAEAK